LKITKKIGTKDYFIFIKFNTEILPDKET